MTVDGGFINITSVYSYTNNVLNTFTGVSRIFSGEEGMLHRDVLEPPYKMVL